jgi:CobW/HypB/UreG, nucleotide-binding domain
MKPTIAVVGGFLGAGKTTLILKAAKLLQARGIKVAAVLNDQGDDLVDTELARRHAVTADQVSGGCFCCRFPDLLDAIGRLGAHHPEVIFAEAVGSCVDLVATTLRPLMRDYAAGYRIAPLTVLVHDEPSEPDLKFLFERQLAEADLVIDRAVNVPAWIEILLGDGIEAAAKSLEVDYRRYAEAEASLGWLNARVTVYPDPPVSPSMLLGPLMDELDRGLAAAEIRIVHLKCIAQSDSGYVKAALTANGREPAVEGMLDASPAAEHRVLVNLRALGRPDHLREIVERAFSGMPASWNLIQSFRPAPPVPYERIPAAGRAELPKSDKSIRYSTD